MKLIQRRQEGSLLWRMSVSAASGNKLCLGTSRRLYTGWFSKQKMVLAPSDKTMIIQKGNQLKGKRSQCGSTRCNPPSLNNLGLQGPAGKGRQGRGNLVEKRSRAANGRVPQGPLSSARCSAGHMQLQRKLPSQSAPPRHRLLDETLLCKGET